MTQSEAITYLTALAAGLIPEFDMAQERVIQLTIVFATLEVTQAFDLLHPSRNSWWTSLEWYDYSPITLRSIVIDAFEATEMTVEIL